MDGEQQELNKTTTGGLVRKIIGALILLIGAAVSFTLVFFAVHYYGVKPVVAWEYGEGIPEIDAFVPQRIGSYVTTLPGKPEKGLNRLTIETGGKEKTVWLFVRDTKAPQAAPVSCTISTKTVMAPNELVSGLKDADRVKLMFEEEPPFGQVGDYEIRILMEDASGNSSSVVSQVKIRVVSDLGVTVETGSEAPGAEAFLVDDYPVESMTEITEAMLHSPGEYPITLTVNGTGYVSRLTVIDTVPPAVTGKTVFCEPEADIFPEMFIESVEDESETHAEFITPPDPDNRDFQTVEIAVTDAGGNVTNFQAGLLLTHSVPFVVEARNTKLTVEECLKDTEYEYALFIKDFIPNTVGFYAVYLQVDGKPEMALVEVIDTTAPVIKTANFKGFTDHPKEASALCTVSDVTETTVSYETEVDWSLEGTQTAVVRAVDAAGNSATLSVTLTLAVDTQPPVLYGIKQRFFYLDEPISYLSGIAAVDNADGEIEIKVDTSQIDTTKAGSYYVTYSATDAAGNTVSKRSVITIKMTTAKNADKLDRYVEQILADILKEDMTPGQKAVAIYNYVYNHVRYKASSDKSDWRKEAIRGIQRGRGDCFTSNSVARALLEECGISVLPITRLSKNTHHYWLLVNAGTGWYHFDATNSREHGFKCCMWTDAQCSVMGSFWRYEKNIYPAVSKERFDPAKTA